MRLTRRGRLTKVFGGAVSSDGTFTGTEPSVAQKMELQQEEKRRIAQFAAGLIQPDDFVYLEDSKATPPFFALLPKDLHPAPIPVTKAMLVKNAPYLSPMDAAHGDFPRIVFIYSSS